MIDLAVEGGNVDIFEEDEGVWEQVLSKWAFNWHIPFISLTKATDN